MTNFKVKPERRQ